MKPEIKHFCQ